MDEGDRVKYIFNDAVNGMGKRQRNTCKRDSLRDEILGE
jgi:hypothetical protein